MSCAPAIVNTLAANSISVQNGASVEPDVRVVAEDLSRPVMVGPLRKRLGANQGPSIVIVSPDCGPMAARRAIRAGAASVVLESQLGETLAPAVCAVAAGPQRPAGAPPERARPSRSVAPRA